MSKTTFENMPQALDHLTSIVEALQESVHVLSSKIENPTEEVWFTVDQLSQYLPDHPAKQTIYEWVNRRLIPYHKRSKRLLFLKTEIDEWMKAGRKKTFEEIAREAQEYSSSKR